MKRVSVEFTESQLKNVIEFIEFEFIDSIRRDECIDNVEYVIDMMNALQSMRRSLLKDKKYCAGACPC